MPKPLSFTGTREEVIAELEERAEDNWHMARDRQSGECVKAADAVKDGARVVDAVQTTFRVEDNPAG
jgi:hypothetical protein